ncbi:MAG TPA: hypothetical protein PKO06_21875, partial [Candidatus Ozemobacteraceae bacterium]|nr:hypothetical protein [Candidatus Ozemobacteraceae bacterium]
PPRPATAADRASTTTTNPTKSSKGYLKVTDSKKTKAKPATKTTSPKKTTTSKSDQKPAGTDKTATPNPAPAEPPTSPDLPAIGDAGRFEM